MSRDIQQFAAEVRSSIVAAAAATTGIREKDLLGPNRSRVFSRPRPKIWRALRELDAEKWSYPVIGAVFYRDHSSIITGVRSAEAKDESLTSSELREFAEAIGQEMQLPCEDEMRKLYYARLAASSLSEEKRAQAASNFEEWLSFFLVSSAPYVVTR
jgi:hypothetical protein